MLINYNEMLFTVCTFLIDNYSLRSAIWY